ncbi:MAG: BTAD domain-containing putative transcriptional regulator, partial [Anaerolineae bacterium]
MTHLDARLLGDVRLSLDRSPVDIRSAKARALFCYLIATRQVHSRDRLAGFFWPDVPDRNALASLRTALYEVRRGLGPGSGRYLIVDRTRISFASGAAYSLDIDIVEAAGPEAGEPDRGVLEAAVAAYGGEFLAGLSVPDSYDFEDWVFLERERLAQLILGALCRLGRAYATEGDYDRAVVTARRVLGVDPLREDVHRSLMEYLTYAGRRSEALAQFAACRKLLHDELGIEPLAATAEVHRRILADELVPRRDAMGGLQTLRPIPEAAMVDEPAVA